MGAGCARLLERSVLAGDRLTSEGRQVFQPQRHLTLERRRFNQFVETSKGSLTVKEVGGGMRTVHRERVLGLLQWHGLCRNAAESLSTHKHDCRRTGRKHSMLLTINN